MYTFPKEGTINLLKGIITNLNFILPKEGAINLLIGIMINPIFILPKEGAINLWQFSAMLTRAPLFLPLCRESKQAAFFPSAKRNVHKHPKSEAQYNIQKCKNTKYKIQKCKVHKQPSFHLQKGKVHKHPNSKAQ